MRALEEAGITVQLGGLPSVLRGLLGIIKVVVTGLEPVYQKLRA